MLERRSTESNGKRLQTVARAARVLQELAAAEGTVALGTLSARVQLGKSTTHLILATLIDAGLVEHGPEKGSYRLGLAALELGAAALNQHGLGVMLSPPMEALAAATREAVSLSVANQGTALLVHRFETDQILRASIRVGARMPLHASASGRCLLAYMPASAQADSIAQLGLTKDEKLQLLKSLDQIQQRGYDVQQDEWALGVSAIAAAVLDPQRSIVAALSISAPTTRFEPEQLLGQLQTAVNDLMHILSSHRLIAGQLIANPLGMTPTG